MGFTRITLWWHDTENHIKSKHYNGPTAERMHQCNIYVFQFHLLRSTKTIFPNHCAVDLCRNGIRQGALSSHQTRGITDAGSVRHLPTSPRKSCHGRLSHSLRCVTATVCNRFPFFRFLLASTHSARLASVTGLRNLRLG